MRFDNSKVLAVGLTVVMAAVGYAYATGCYSPSNPTTVEECKECKAQVAYQDVIDEKITMLEALRYMGNSQYWCEQQVCKLDPSDHGHCPQDCIHGCQCSNGGMLPGC